MIVHNTGIPIESRLEAFEFGLPFKTIHESCDKCWIEWVELLAGQTPQSIQSKISERLDAALPEFQSLAGKIRNYEPFSILFYGGVPHVWAARNNRGYPDSIYIPPPAPVDHLTDRLRSFPEISRIQISNFVSVFGGIGQRYPWEAVEFDREGKLINGSVRLLHGDDGTEWAITHSGEIQHRDHGAAWSEQHLPSINSFVDKFTSCAEIDLFEFAYR